MSNKIKEYFKNKCVLSLKILLFDKIHTNNDLNPNKTKAERRLDNVPISYNIIKGRDLQRFFVAFIKCNKISLH